MGRSYSTNSAASATVIAGDRGELRTEQHEFGPEAHDEPVHARLIRLRPTR
jgi:hypothetical protein